MLLLFQRIIINVLQVHCNCIRGRGVCCELL